MTTVIRYEYGIFNADKEKICAANHVSTDDIAWAWLWDTPIDLRLNESDAKKLVNNINTKRDEEGILETHGPVCVRRRKITVGDWED